MVPCSSRANQVLTPPVVLAGDEAVTTITTAAIILQRVRPGRTALSLP